MYEWGKEDGCRCYRHGLYYEDGKNWLSKGDYQVCWDGYILWGRVPRKKGEGYDIYFFNSEPSAWCRIRKWCGPLRY